MNLSAIPNDSIDIDLESDPDFIHDTPSRSINSDYQLVAVPNNRWVTPPTAAAISPLVAMVRVRLNFVELDDQGSLIY